VDEKAIETVRQLKFQPVTKDGQRVSVLNTIRIIYKAK